MLGHMNLSSLKLFSSHVESQIYNFWAIEGGGHPIPETMPLIVYIETLCQDSYNFVFLTNARELICPQDLT